MKLPFGGHILVLGCGSVSRCLQPLLMQHLEMDFSKITLMDFADLRHLIPASISAGVNYVQDRITREDLAQKLSAHLAVGDLLIDLAWNIDTGEIIQWCHDHHVLYLNTSVELWDPYEDTTSMMPTERTLYVRHMALQKRVKSWSEKGPTAVIEHGANPGLASHWTKAGLEDIAAAMFKTNLEAARRKALETAIDQGNFAQLAMLEGVKVIHISERDTQISHQPKKVNEFVNTWSVEGLYEEGIAPAEMGWGTHERRLPPNAHKHTYGVGNQICLAQMGINTYVRSWVPTGEIIGMVVRHGEAFTISNHLTVWNEEKPIYRPTVHYAYLPTDAAMNSLHELEMRNFQLQEAQRIMTNEIDSGKDELGVLLLGHDLNGWWVGSQLDIHEARQFAPGQNATTLQVAASILSAVMWMIRNPQQGLCVPDDLPHREILSVANPYLGTSPSIQTDWTPLKYRIDLFENFGRPRPSDEDIWQFETFLVL